MPGDKDIVEQAREILRDATMQPFLFGVTRDTFRVLADEVERLRELIVHMHVHSGYRDNGYMQMTTPQKALYDAIWARSVAELDAEEADHANRSEYSTE